MEKYEDRLTNLNAEIWDLAELKFQERKSCERMTAFLEQEGFHVERNVTDIPTAYVGTYGSGKPIIGILAEYDALSGLSQVADLPEKKERKGISTGHGCGHNLLGTGSIGAALKVRDYLKETGNSGTVKIIGCPAEEGGSGKTFMAKAGVFNDLDAAITWHPYSLNGVITGTFLANIQSYFRFKGISTHAAATPYLGRNALSAVQLMNMGVNALRENTEETNRINYAITDTGGTSPNVIQANAEVLYLVRSSTTEKVNELYNRVLKIAKGAALMTETELEIEFDKACSSVIPNSALEQVLYESFLKVGLPEYTEKDMEYAKKFRATISDKEIADELAPGLAIVPKPKAMFERIISSPIADFIIPHKHSNILIPGSTDVGDVSRVVPTAQIFTACYVVGTSLHSWQAVAQGKSPIAVKGMLLAAEVMGDAIIRLMKDKKALEAAKIEFIEATEGKKYISPIPDGVKPKIL